MKTKHFLPITVFIVLAVFAATVMAGRMMTINGTITEDFLLVDDNGEIYIVTESDKAEQLLENVGRRVTATGDVEDGDDGPVISIQGFKVLSE